MIYTVTNGHYRHQAFATASGLQIVPMGATELVDVVGQFSPEQIRDFAKRKIVVAEGDRRGDAPVSHAASATVAPPASKQESRAALIARAESLGVKIAKNMKNSTITRKILAAEGE